jgi:YHS domain-containing protein
MTRDAVCGKTYYFCSAACKTNFGKAPAKHAAK